MPIIRAVRTALPQNRVEQSTVREFARGHFSGKNVDIERLLPIYENTGIVTRYLAEPISWYQQIHSLAEKNRLYIEHATSLAADASKRLIRELDLAAADIDYIIYVNTTGLATPSIDARLINMLGLRSNVRRTPIWGLGCAGGASGLAHAYHHALGHPHERILLVAVEICSLTFLANDFSKSNIVASALFADGAAAVLIEGDEVAEAGSEDQRLAILGSQSTFFPDSLDVMGWNVVEKGLQVVFARHIPDIVADNILADMMSFTNRHDLALSDISHFLVHPGGSKVIDAYSQALGLDHRDLELSRQTIKNYGNMSSVTVLFVLAEFLKNGSFEAGDYAILSALGPGFSSESVLLAGHPAN